jgi:hypothetical protein
MWVMRPRWSRTSIPRVAGGQRSMSRTSPQLLASGVTAVTWTPRRPAAPSRSRKGDVR